MYSINKLFYMTAIGTVYYVSMVSRNSNKTIKTQLPGVTMGCDRYEIQRGIVAALVAWASQ